MFDKIIETLSRVSNDNQECTRRRFPRRIQDNCVCDINGTSYPVKDWSQCGVLIETDGRRFEAEGEVPVTMKFRLAESVVECTLPAQIVRKGRTQVAFEFHKLPMDVQGCFNRVIDDALARGFADTQKA